LKKFILDTTGLTDPNEPIIDPVENPNNNSDPEADPENDPETDPETDPVTDPVTDPETDPEADPETDPEPSNNSSVADLSSICSNYNTMHQQCSSDQYNTAQCSGIMTQYSSLKSEIDVLKSDLTNKETMLEGLKNNYEICQNCTSTYPLVTAACGSYF
jgi:hypothetical protein